MYWSLSPLVGTTVKFKEYACASDGMPHVLCGIAKSRVVCPPRTGAPNGPAASRVSAIRHGVTGTKRRPAGTFTTAPAWVIVKLWPATVSVPVRAEAPLLASAWNETVPLATPDVPAVTLSHDALLVAFQLQPPCDVTLTVPSAAVAGSPVLTAERV